MPAKISVSRSWPSLFAWLAFCLSIAIGPAVAADPDALWKILHDRCMPNQMQHGDPAPCAKVALDADEKNGYVILKDLVGVAQFLLMPTEKITGIEDTQLLRPNMPDYWLDAWNERQWMAKVLSKPVPDQDIGLAVNSEYGRSQNQLHIHIDCIRADVKQALADASPRITHSWSSFMLPLAGQSYRVRLLTMDDLAHGDPFTLLAATDHDAKRDMASQTLALVGADGHGFYLLEDHAQPASGDRASAEQILDHDCAVLGR